MTKTCTALAALALALCPALAHAEDAAFTLESNTFAKGAKVTLRFAAPLQKDQGRHWVCIVKKGVHDSSYGIWAYAKAGATEATLEAPLREGTFEVRLHGSYPRKSHNILHREIITVGTAKPAPKPPGDAPKSGEDAPKPKPRPKVPAANTPKPDPSKLKGMKEGELLIEFDTIYDAQRAALDSPEGKDAGTVRLTIEKLRLPLEKLYYDKNHAEAKTRFKRLREAVARADAAFGPLQRLKGADRKARSAYYRVVEKLERPLRKALDPIRLQDKGNRAEAERLISEQFAALNKIKTTQNLFFYEEQAKLRQLRAKFNKLTGRSQELAKEAGDVDGTLDLIQKQFPYRSFDPSLGEPHTPHRVEMWAKNLKNWRAAVPAALKFFAHARKTSLKARSSEFNQYVHWFNQNVASAIDSAVKRQTRHWKEDAGKALRYLSREIGGERWPRLLRDPKWVKEWTASLERGLNADRCLLAFNEHYLGHEKPDPALVREAQETMAMQQKVAGGVQEAIKKARLAKGIGEPKLLGIAKKAMGADARGIRVTAPTEREKYVHWRRISDTMLEGTPYVSYTFWVNYAEEHEGKWYICSAKIMRIVGGGDDGEWRFGGIWRHQQILEENIDK